MANGNTEPISEPIITTGTIDGTDERSNVGFSFPAIEPTSEPIKRGRGRPKGSRNNASGSNTQTETTSKKKQVKPSQREALAFAEMLVQYAEMTATLVLGSDASFNEVERGTMLPSLTRMVERMDFTQVDTFNRFADPLALVAGLSMWTLRVVAPKLQSRKEKKVNNAKSKSHSNHTYEPSSNGQTSSVSNAGKVAG